MLFFVISIYYRNYKIHYIFSNQQVREIISHFFVYCAGCQLFFSFRSFHINTKMILRILENAENVR